MAFIASLLGIRHLLIAVNKMDLVDYRQDIYDTICQEYRNFVAGLAATELTFIPISALQGDNVVEASDNMPWYHGNTLLHHLETVEITSEEEQAPCRFPVQYVLRPDANFRGYCGTLASGTLNVGDVLMVLPSG